MDANTALWSLISQTDWFTKAILCLLTVMSVICWSILFYKATSLNKKMRELKLAQMLLSKIRSLEDLIIKFSDLQLTYPGKIVAELLTEYKMLATSDVNKNYLHQKEWELLQTNITHVIDVALQKEEAYIPILSTSAACATLIGLFGTVWGLIHAFLGIGIRRTADIASVAPGIAEALITTLGGLMLAIPALVMFNYLSVKIKHFEQQLIIIAEKCSAIMALTLNDNKHASYEKPVQIVKTVAIE